MGRERRSPFGWHGKGDWSFPLFCNEDGSILKCRMCKCFSAFMDEKLLRSPPSLQVDAGRSFFLFPLPVCQQEAAARKAGCRRWSPFLFNRKGKGEGEKLTFSTTVL